MGRKRTTDVYYRQRCPHGINNKSICPHEECRVKSPGNFCILAWKNGQRGNELPRKHKCPLYETIGHAQCFDAREAQRRHTINRRKKLIIIPEDLPLYSLTQVISNNMFNDDNNNNNDITPHYQCLDHEEDQWKNLINDIF
jgi:hypothetical protein